MDLSGHLEVSQVERLRSLEDNMKDKINTTTRSFYQKKSGTLLSENWNLLSHF